ncbi:hypothetical protein L218DRAFT_1007745 [Marasmius fiardii PR-910]|nr:hypothetical protein L218DRAFT_1007745 [Marasmius fiardii PR-910]
MHHRVVGKDGTSECGAQLLKTRADDTNYMNKLTQKDAICEWGSGVVEGSAQRNLIELYIHRIIDLELSLEQGVRLYKFR